MSEPIDPPTINRLYYAAAVKDRLRGANEGFIKQIPLFRGLPEAQVEQLLLHVESRFYTAGGHIIEQGSRNQHIFFIQNGIAAVTYKASQYATPEHYAYLRENDIFGEAGIFAEGNHYATADVTAITDVDLLVLPYHAFIEILENYHPAALEVARILTERLTSTSDKLVREYESQNLYLVVGVGTLSRATTLGSALVTTLGASEGKEPVFTRYPNAQALSDIYKLPKKSKSFYPIEGESTYDIYIPHGLPKLPPELQFNIIWEDIQDKYGSIVFVIQDRYLQDLNEILEFAKAVILVATPAEWNKLQTVSSALRDSPFLITRDIIPILTNNDADDEDSGESSGAHFVLPFLVGLPPILPKIEDMPIAMRTMLDSLVQRLDSQVEVKIHLATDLGPQDIPYDQGILLERVLWFAKSAFGKIKTTPEHERDEVNNVNRQFTVISSYVDQEFLNKNWQRIISELKRIREEVTDIKLAVELNHHLVLV